MIYNTSHGQGVSGFSMVTAKCPIGDQKYLTSKKDYHLILQLFTKGFLTTNKSTKIKNNIWYLIIYYSQETYTYSKEWIWKFSISFFFLLLH